MSAIKDPLDPNEMVSLKNWGGPEGWQAGMHRNVTVDCGWGRLIFAQTFGDSRSLAAELLAERPGARDIATYLRDPHVVLSLAPQELFLDPSHTFRLPLARYEPATRPTHGYIVRRLERMEDGEQANRIYDARNMVRAQEGFYWRRRKARELVLLVAQDVNGGAIIGIVTGIDHVAAFDDPDHGSSLWALAVDPQTPHLGVGEALVRALVETMAERGRAFVDLSVMHDNAYAIALYEKLGFAQVPVFTIKRKNPINESLFLGPAPDEEKLNPYARLITTEARRRGITVEVLDAAEGFFKLILGGRSVTCRESLSELTSAVAMTRCDNKRITRKLMAQAGLAVPAQITVREADDAQDFLAEHGRVVVKPLRGEQGAGVRVDLAEADEVAAAVENAKRFCDEVLVESFHEGQDLRIIVIGDRVVAGAVRRPAEIQGDGRHTVRELIQKQSRRRAAATGGESRIPLDDETLRTLKSQGLGYDDRLEQGRRVIVRKTANLHTGGTIHDVTDHLHPALIDAAVRGAQALEIPLVGFDFLVPSPSEPDYVIIEANERPGLANHEPQPTAERFIDLLFPQTKPIPSQLAGAEA